MYPEAVKKLSTQIKFAKSINLQKRFKLLENYKYSALFIIFVNFFRLETDRRLMTQNDLLVQPAEYHVSP